MRAQFQILRKWAIEGAAIAFAIGLIVAIGAILATHDGKELPNWGNTLNLNAVLALLSTFLRALLVMIVAKIISQRKWSWFADNNVRPLSDLQKFDAGSRGSSGALLLLPTVLRRDPITLLAAFVIVASFLVGPFVQQASRTVNCNLPKAGAAASIPFAHWVPRRGAYQFTFGAGTLEYADDLVVATLSSILSPDGVENQISGNCATGNCTFNDLTAKRAPTKDGTDQVPATHSTVGMCNICTDVSSLVTQNTTSRKFILPNGYNYTAAQSYGVAVVKSTPDLDWMGNLFTDNLRTRSRWAYVNATFISNTTSDGPVASVCSLYPCLKTYEVSLWNNKLEEELVKEEPMRIEYTPGDQDETKVQAGLKSLQSQPKYDTSQQVYYHNFTAITSPCRVNGKDLDASKDQYDGPDATQLNLYTFTANSYTSQSIKWPDQCIFRQDPRFVDSLYRILSNNVFWGTCTNYKGRLECNKLSETSDPSDKMGELLDGFPAATVSRTLFNEYKPSYAHTKDYFDGIAKAMTNRFRFDYGSAQPPPGYMTSGYTPASLPDIDVIQGIAWDTTACVAVHKGWLLFPISLTAITAIIFILTILDGWRHRNERPVWTDSILAYIFYGRNFESQGSGPLQAYGTKGEYSSDRALAEGANTALMERNDMNDMASKTMVSFRWSGNADEGDQGISSGNAAQENIPLKSRGIFATHTEVPNDSQTDLMWRR